MPRGFTLVELLIVVAVLATLAGLVVPAVVHAIAAARIATAHYELRGITEAIGMYRLDNDGRIPPTRMSCSSRTAYELPVELLRYLPGGRKNDVDIVRMPDPFTPEEGYRYRAVGAAIMNESTILEHGATLWVPDGFGGDESETGRYYNDPDTSPVLYAVWSMGPDPRAAKFDIPGRLPVPRKYWLRHSGDTGVIVHLEDSRGGMHLSP